MCVCVCVIVIPRCCKRGLSTVNWCSSLEKMASCEVCAKGDRDGGRLDDCEDVDDERRTADACWELQPAGRRQS